MSQSELVIDIDSYFELDRCVEFILNGNYSSVAIQLPFTYLKYAAHISSVLRNVTGTSRVTILGDSAHSSCCVDDIQAKKIAAECIIHFGHACFSRSTQMPLLYIYNQNTYVNMDVLKNQFESLFTDRDTRIIIFYDVTFERCALGLYKLLKLDYKLLEITYLEHNRGSSEIEQTATEPLFIYEYFGRKCYLSESIDNFCIFYIGPEGNTLFNLRLSFINTIKFYQFDPSTKSVSLINEYNSFLKKRYYKISKVNEANLIGLLIGNLIMPRQNEIIVYIKKLLRKSSKKVYTISLGQLKPTKLGNFLEIDMFVYVGCYESQIFDDGEFHRPIISPFELQLGLSGNPCDIFLVNYITDSSKLNTHELSINLISNGVEFTESNYISLSTEISIKPEYSVDCISTAGSFLHDRLWKGLELNSEIEQPSLLSEGRSGIPIQYSSELFLDTNTTS